MLYTTKNVAPGTTVYDVDRLEKIQHVLKVDDQKNVVVCGCMPVQVVDGEILTYEIRFRAVHTIKGRECLPGLFHCYGRLE